MEQTNALHTLETYVSSKPLLSYSGLSKYLYSPTAFYNYYVLNQKEDFTTESMTRGKLVHAFLLEPDTIFDKFFITSSKIPDEKNQKILKDLYKFLLENEITVEKILDSYATKLGELMKEVDYFAAMKEDEARGKKMLTEINTSYWTYILESSVKIPISQEDYDSAKLLATSFKNDKVISFLLSNGKAETELSMSAPENLLFGLRAFIDYFRIHAKSKTIYVSDIKVTSKRIQDFPETIEYYNYWLQAGIYYKILKHIYPEYNIIFTFIVSDVYNICYPFKVSDETMKTYLDRTNALLNTVNHAFDERYFTLPVGYKDYKITL